MTSCTKAIWIVVFQSDKGSYTQKVAAYNLSEVLSYFNEDAPKRITKIEKTEDEVTYQY